MPMQVATGLGTGSDDLRALAVKKLGRPPGVRLCYQGTKGDRLQSNSSDVVIYVIYYDFL